MITLTGKNCGLEERAPMCGVPYHSVEGYLNKLVSRGYKVAICEQVEECYKKGQPVLRHVPDYEAIDKLLELITQHKEEDL